MRLSLSLFLLLLFTNCTQKKNYKTVDSKLSYASLLSIIKYDHYTEVQLINPDNNSIHKKYGLSNQIKNIPPNQGLIPIKIPISSIITLAGTDIGMLAKLNCSHNIKGITNPKYVYNQTVRQKAQKGLITSFSDINQLNPEKVLPIANIITYSGFGTPIAQEEKLNKLGINCIPVYDWRENHPLGKAEWIKLYGLLFNKEKEASNYFLEVEKAYKKLKKQVVTIKSKPNVLSGSMIGDTWFMPAAQSFNANLIADAKGDFVGKSKKGTGSSSFTLEEVFVKFRSAQIWINPMFDRKSTLLQANQKYQYFDAFKQNEIYCYSHKMNYFWENSAIEPHKVLSDLIQIFHKGQIPKKKLYFYKKIK
jgi:iron complex transport system substrate-binding protein